MVTPDKNNANNCIKGISEESPNDPDPTLCVGNTSSAYNGMIPYFIIV
ncbi:MAG TPA: hypothetical protein VH500_21300 [Nitrososphaeraceae archaeon]|jgi:hypothetical protein